MDFRLVLINALAPHENRPPVLVCCIHIRKKCSVHVAYTMHAYFYVDSELLYITLLNCVAVFIVNAFLSTFYEARDI